MSWCIPFHRTRKIWDQIEPGHRNSPSFSHWKSEGAALVLLGSLRNILCFPCRKASAVKWDQQPVFCLQGRRDGPESFPNALLIPWLLLEAKGAGMRRLCPVGAGCYWSFPWKPINTTWGGRWKLHLILKYCWKGGNRDVPFGSCRNKHVSFTKKRDFPRYFLPFLRNLHLVLINPQASVMISSAPVIMNPKCAFFHGINCLPEHICEFHLGIVAAC